MDEEYGERPETRGTQLLYSHNVYVADEASVRERVRHHSALIRSHVGDAADVRARDINIGRGGDARGLLFDTVALVTTLFDGCRRPVRPSFGGRRLLNSEGLEEVCSARRQTARTRHSRCRRTWLL